MPLHPAFAAAVEAGLASGRPGLSQGTVESARALVDNGAKALGDGPAIDIVRDISISTRGGIVPARLFAPGHPKAVIVYFHGGGWVAGSVASFDALGRSLAARSECAVLSVDYRLAPEHPFPAGAEDAEDAIRWVGSHMGELAPPGCPLMVAGDSAGANLAAVSSMALCGQVHISLQLLFYPVVDCNFNTSSYETHGKGLPLTREDMIWFFENYAPRERWAEPGISALRADVRSSPPTWMGLAEFDVLNSEGKEFAERLAAAGVAVEVRNYVGLAHGFARWFNVADTAGQALDDFAQAARAVIGKHAGNRSSSLKELPH